MKRRDFVIALGAGAGVSIAGYFCYRQLPMSNSKTGPADTAGSEFLPRLADDVVLGRLDDQLTISRGEEAEAVVCTVNAMGAAIIDRLDGRHTVEQIAGAVAELLTEPPAQSLEAKVAVFAAQLAECGFLKDPFYTTIYETVDGS